MAETSKPDGETWLMVGDFVELVNVAKALSILFPLPALRILRNLPPPCSKPES